MLDDVSLKAALQQYDDVRVLRFVDAGSAWRGFVNSHLQVAFEASRCLFLLPLTPSVFDNIYIWLAIVYMFIHIAQHLHAWLAQHHNILNTLFAVC